MPYVALLTAANPTENLEHLKEEFRSLGESFAYPGKEVIDPYVNLDATEKSIFLAYLGNTDIRIFHFSGHAGDASMLMGDGNLSRGNVLTSMMGKKSAEKLELVFLNGCATYDLVEKFLAQGAKCVIATRTPVFDRIAAEFSSSFYNSLCVNNWTITQSFEFARSHVQQIATERIRAIRSMQDADSETAGYGQMLDDFLGRDVQRTIGREENRRPEMFAWSIYPNAAAGEEWRIRDDSPGEEGYVMRQQPLYPEPSMKLLQSIGINAGRLAERLRNDPKHDPADPHIVTLGDLAARLPNVKFWTRQTTKEYIQKVNSILLLPLALPFSELINLGNDGRPATKYGTAAVCKKLLELQLDLYKAFMRTATIIMLSDLVESIVNVSLSGDPELKAVLGECLRKNPGLVSSFREIISGSRNVDDIQLGIGIMRDIVSLLSDARNSVTYPEQKKIFSQFIREYHGNTYGSDEEKAIQDGIHQEMLMLRKRSEDLNGLDIRRLRSYCDRAETALIELFKAHNYLLLYEIVTVGRVEANRRRDILTKTISHNVFDFNGLIPSPYVTMLEQEFAENYSVLLVSHKSKIQPYLSLSPFLINVGPFYQEETLWLLYFFGRNGKKIQYNDCKAPSPMAIRIDTEIDIDAIDEFDHPRFLTVNPEVIGMEKTTHQDESARLLFDRVRAQYNNLVEQFLAFLQPSKTDNP